MAGIGIDLNVSQARFSFLRYTVAVPFVLWLRSNKEGTAPTVLGTCKFVTV
jgi:hypothetical protein